MRRIAAASSTALAVAISQACSQAPSVDVIAADGALCDLTRRLAGSQLNVACLLSPTDAPHQLQLTPAQTRQIHQAQLVLINGYGLTPALEGLGNAVKVAELAVPDSPQLQRSGAPSEKHETHDDRGHGEHDAAAHAHGERDPHVWHDPRQAQAMVSLVSERLERIRPQAAPQIQARAQAMQHSLSDLHRWNRQQFATISAPRILASGHRAFASLARAYQLQELAVVDEGSTSEALRPQTLARAVNTLQQQGVRSLFAEQQRASKALQRISSLSGVPLAEQPLLADSAGDNLIATLTANTCLIVDALGGRCNQARGAELVRAWSAIR